VDAGLDLQTVGPVASTPDGMTDPGNGAATNVAAPEPAAPPTDGALLTVEGLAVRYGTVEALRGVSLTVREGRALALVGPNGAGKTTFLRAISGLIGASAGRVVLSGREILGQPAWKVARGGLAHVPEGRAIIEPLTVRENLLMGAYAASGDDVEERLERMIQLFPALDRRLRVHAGLLSGGEQQMLAIARGLMSNPQLLAIDEPSMGLAPVVVDDVLEGLRRAVASGISVLLIEQNLQIALELADHVCVLVNGEIVLSRSRQDAPEDLLAMYIEGEKD
jgi:branched-chain amino acid transport system ATP-binding protein